MRNRQPQIIDLKVNQSIESKTDNSQSFANTITMKPSRFKKVTQAFFAFALALILMMTAMTAEAKRFGGGKSMGRQNSNAVQKYQQSPQNAQNMQNPQNPQNPQNAQSAQPANAYNTAGQVKKPSMFGGFGKVLAGVAAVAGLAWLASALGIQDELMGMFGIMLAVMLIFALFAWFKKRKQAQNLAYAGASVGSSGSLASSASSAASNQYHSNNLGNQERFNNTAAYQTSAQQNASFGQQGSQAIFNSDMQKNSHEHMIADDRPLYARDFEQYAPQFFEDVQKLHQKGAHETLAKLLTPEMYENFKTDATEDPDQPNGSNTYLVRSLVARVLDQYQEDNKYYLSVLYQGSFYENDWQRQKNEESTINEIWQMVANQPAAGENLVWRLDGITQISTKPAEH